MNHQPFETWLLSEEPLLPEDQVSLDVHLETCEYCQRLQASWFGVMDLFGETPNLIPPPDFMNRWQSRLSQERLLDIKYRHRWQSIIMLILISNVIVALVLLLGTQFLTTIDTPADLILPMIYRITSAITFVSAIQNLVEPLFRTFTSIIPLPIWAAFGAGLVAAGAIWVISMKSLSVLSRRNLQ